MKTNKYITMLATVAIVSLTSCTDWLDQEPMSNVTTSEYFKTQSDFTSAANNLYSQLIGYRNDAQKRLFDVGTDLNCLGSDELSGNNGAPASDTGYELPYKNLRHVNNLLSQAEKYTGTASIDVSVGTAYFFRAYWHFYLLQRFGGVTLALSVPETTSDFVWGPRNSRYEVFASILSDLNKAQQLMAGVTKTSTGNSGTLTIEAISAFKARVCLYEGTWEKYNGRGAADSTNGDGTASGAGTAMPEGYPTVEEMLTTAKMESAKFVGSGTYASEYSIFMACEDHDIDYYKRQSYFYLFALEDAASNPYGVTKADNDEAILRKCYDYSKQVYGGENITHTQPVGGTRKLMDMYLCTDGLPVNKSPLFKGYDGLTSEFENRDARMVATFKQIGHSYWSANNEHGVPADYSMAPADSPANISGIFYPRLDTYSSSNFNGELGYVGRKFTEERERPTYQESADLMVIRLPEMLVTYAEATIELNGSISDTELDQTINVIRKRAHIANLSNELVNKYGLDMKQEIRRERSLELFGEGFRFDDLCRWGIAEDELQRPVCTYYVGYNGKDTELATADRPDGSGKKIYVASVWEGDKIVKSETPQSSYAAGMPTVKPGCLITTQKVNRNFTKKNYLQAIPTDQIVLNPELKQNPQW